MNLPYRAVVTKPPENRRNFPASEEAAPEVQVDHERSARLGSYSRGLCLCHTGLFVIPALLVSARFERLTDGI